MHFYQRLISDYLKEHFKNHRLINVKNHQFNYVIEKHTLFVIDYFFLLNKSKFDQNFINLFYNFQKNKEIMSYLKNTTIYLYHELCEDVYFTQQSHTLLLNSIKSIFYSLQKNNVKNICFTKSFFNLLYVFKKQNDVFETLIKNFNILFNTNLNDAEWTQTFKLHSNLSKELFLKDYDFYSFENVFKKLNSKNIEIKYNNLFIFNNSSFDESNLVYSTKYFVNSNIETYINNEFKLSIDLILYLNKKFNKSYDPHYLKMIGDIDIYIFLDIYWRNNHTLLDNLKEIEINNINFIALKEKIFLNEQIKNF